MHHVLPANLRQTRWTLIPRLPEPNLIAILLYVGYIILTRNF